MVFTPKYHIDRGYCYGSGCRHCPYHPIHIKENIELEEQYKTKKMSVVVKNFGAKWCGPCRALGPVLEGLKNDFADKVTFIEYDVENSPEESQQYNVTSIPVVRDGVLVERFQGLSSKMAYVWNNRRQLVYF